MSKVRSYTRTRSDTGTVSHVREHDRRGGKKERVDKKKRRESRGSLEQMARKETSPLQPEHKRTLTKEELKRDKVFLSRVFGGAAAKAALAGAAAVVAASSSAVVGPLAVGVVVATVAAESSFSHVLHSRLAQRSTKRKPGEPEEGKNRRTFSQWAVDKLAGDISTHTNAVSYAGIGALVGMAFPPLGPFVGGALGFSSSYALSRNSKKIEDYQEDVSEGKPALRKKIETQEKEERENKKEIRKLSRENEQLRESIIVAQEGKRLAEEEVVERKANEELLLAEVDFLRARLAELERTTSPPPPDTRRPAAPLAHSADSPTR